MPIISIEYVKREHEVLEDKGRKVQSCAEAIGRALKAREGSVWVKFRQIECDEYAENGASNLEFYPLFVHILKYEYELSDETRKQTTEIVRALAGIFERPEENIHVIYEEGAKGRIAFGGVFV